MSTTENEEVTSPEAPVDAAVGVAAPSEADAAKADAEGTDAAEAAPIAEEANVEDDDESLDIEVEASDDDEPEVELDPVAELEAKLAEAEKGKKDNYDRFVRATADLENVRKRSRREIKDGRLDERGKILRDMLPVVDNLERAVEHAEQTAAEATKSIVEGVQMVLRQFHQSLERHNVKAIEAVGQPFDPALHEAVSQAPSSDYPPGTVVSVLQTGYTVEERLLRPALAVVSIAMPTATADAIDAEVVAEDAAAESEDAVASDAVASDAATDEAEATDAAMAEPEPEGQE
ncbi:MAG: nucleotide exchange factor GrpE [Myxococcales bacterium]|nr:nucleotide exchange factor GrpE [Myxococcales bacterium]